MTPPQNEPTAPPAPPGPGARIKSVRQRMGLSQKTFASELGLSQSTLSQIENDHYYPGYESLFALGERYNVDYNWLLRGVGIVFGEDPAPTQPATPRGFPAVTEKALAGYSDRDRDEHWLSQLDRYTLPGYRPEAEIVIFQSLGDSMTPTIVDQDFVIAERVHGTPESFTGQPVVVVKADEIYVKRIANFDLVTEVIMLSSDNPAHQTIELPYVAALEIWHVVGRITRSLAPTILNQDYRIQQLERRLQDLAATVNQLGSSSG